MQHHFVARGESTAAAARRHPGGPERPGQAEGTVLGEGARQNTKRRPLGERRRREKLRGYVGPLALAGSERKAPNGLGVASRFQEYESTRPSYPHSGPHVA